MVMADGKRADKDWVEDWFEKIDYRHSRPGHD
jgi:hypothetical protein